MFKVYPQSDPLIRLLAILWVRQDRALIGLLNDVAYQFYGSTCSILAKACELAGYTPTNKKEAA